MQDCSIAAEGCGQVDFVLVLDAGRCIRWSVDGEAEVAVDFCCDVGFEDDGHIGVGAVDVVGVFDYRGIDIVIVVFVEVEDVAGWTRALEGQEVGVAGIYTISLVLAISCWIMWIIYLSLWDTLSPADQRG